MHRRTILSENGFEWLKIPVRLYKLTSQVARALFEANKRLKKKLIVILIYRYTHHIQLISNQEAVLGTARYQLDGILGEADRIGTEDKKNTPEEIQFDMHQQENRIRTVLHIIISHRTGVTILSTNYISSNRSNHSIYYYYYYLQAAAAELDAYMIKEFISRCVTSLTTKV
ncbi:hypothetical protein QE152_g33323 [Popillia japonica]|uniref:Uncharacterized protein n=1 Tax=Popillia japonica TaxID=7064 RepID=A0AAW1IX16_POPJA